MKLVALSSGVTVPAWQLVGPGDDAAAAARGLRYPLFVKPSAYGDSLGIDEHSLVTTPAELEHQLAAKLPEFGRLLVEEYIDGRELTVLVKASPDHSAPPLAFTPIEFLFPPARTSRRTTSRSRSSIPSATSRAPRRTWPRASRLRPSRSSRASRARATRDGLPRRSGGAGVLPRSELHLFDLLPEGYQGSADYILAFDGIGQSGFLRAIIDEGLARHARRQLPYAVKPSGDGFAMFAARDLPSGSVVFEGEGRPQRIVTRSHVDRTWSAAGPGRVLPLCLPHQPRGVRALGHRADRLGAAEPLLRSEHGVVG